MSSNSRSDLPRANENIRAPKIRLIDANGEMVGVVSVREGIAMAQEAGLDLVEVSPNAEPPVCKLLDLGKYKYEIQKRANEARKKQKIVQIKEIKIRPMIDQHDYEVKVRKVKEFLEEGDKVKITMRVRGREMAHQNSGMELLIKVKAEFADVAKVESEPRLEGR
ncbi:MAG: translation initiation factor IF-3, partial [Alphaproteobacteria bacterium]|nr:translation initiation factor IF-3 [Alphaproteobacteria bacterium]